MFLYNYCQRYAMRSAVLDFKSSEFIHYFLQRQGKAHQIAYRDCSGRFSLDVRLNRMLSARAASNLAYRCCMLPFS